jgi:peptide chain release factor 1
LILVERGAPGMFPEERLRQMKKRLEEVEASLADPEVLADPRRLALLSRERAELEPAARILKEKERLEADLAAARQLEAEADPASAEVLREEIEEIEKALARLEEEARELLVPRDPYSGRDVLVEVRAGVGGEEAALFARDLVEMYLRFAQRKGWRAEVISSSPTDLGGFREAVIEVKGKSAYPMLKFESGVHRVQRVPVTESGGRIHTSTATVAVLPEADEIEVEISPKDLKVEVFRASGPGGQYVNTTESAVRITHLPTGITVSCQEERSQLQNRERAMRILRARLLALEEERRREEEARMRRAQVGTGERSEKIRTYNFPQNRVTDHRVGLTLHKLAEVLAGDLDEIVEALLAREREEALAAAGR